MSCLVYVFLKYFILFIFNFLKCNTHKSAQNGLQYFIFLKKYSKDSQGGTGKMLSGVGQSRDAGVPA